jgi:hypothetical protein
MKIQRRHVGVLALLLVGGLVFGSGCAENRSSLFVRGAMVVPTDTCEVTADAAAPMLFRGLLDVGLAAEHRGVLLVGNQLVRRGNNATLRTETSRIQLSSADVEVFDALGGSLGAFSVPVSGFADPGSASEPGFGAAQVVMVDSASATAALAGGKGPVEVVASVILHGETLGGVAVDAGEWRYPIDICNGCSVFFPPGSDDPANFPIADCNILDDATFNCHSGIDSATDCRSCPGVAACVPPQP